MAEFTPKIIELNKINNGQRFRDGDGVSPDAINAPIEAAALLQNLATNAPDNTDANQIGNPQVSIEGEGSNIHFVFKNLKGETGVEIVQTTGESETAVMSQKAVTAAIDSLDIGLSVIDGLINIEFEEGL